MVGDTTKASVARSRRDDDMARKYAERARGLLVISLVKSRIEVTRNEFREEYCKEGSEAETQ
jgi:hypothetical protein